MRSLILFLFLISCATVKEYTILDNKVSKINVVETMVGFSKNNSDYGGCLVSFYYTNKSSLAIQPSFNIKISRKNKNDIEFNYTTKKAIEPEQKVYFSANDVSKEFDKALTHNTACNEITDIKVLDEKYKDFKFRF